MKRKETVKSRLEEVTLARIDDLEYANREDSEILIDEVKVLTDSLNEIEKTKNGKKERRLKFAGEILAALIGVGGYIGLHAIAMKYEDEGHAFSLSSTKTNLNKANFKK